MEQANGRLQLKKAQHPESSQGLNTLEMYSACFQINSILWPTDKKLKLAAKN